MNDKALVPLEPRDLTELKGVAQIFAASGLFADAKDMAQAFVKIMAGREAGFGAFASMQNVHIISGKPVLSAHMMAAAVKRNPKYDYQIVELTDSVCVLEFYQDGRAVGTVRQTLEDAKKAKVTGNQTWEKYPRNMLFARAISNGVRWYCPDAFDMPVYTPDELGAEDDSQVPYDNDTGEVIEGAFTEDTEPEPEPPAPTPNPRRIPDAAPPTDNRLVKPEPAQTPDNGAAGADESHWTNDMARLRKFLAWAEDFWKPIERPHAVNRVANALGLNGTPNGNKDLLFEMMLAQYKGSDKDAAKAVQLYEPATPPADVKLMPDKDAMPFDGPCDMCGETTVLTVAGGTFRCKACAEQAANEAAAALAKKRGKKELKPTGTEG